MKSQEYIVQVNITLAFETKGRQYKLKLNVEEGLLVLDEYENGKNVGTKYQFLGSYETYEGEAKFEVRDNFIETKKCENEPSSSPKLNKKKKKKKK